ncbi:hypothetical protein ACL6C3_25345 [Capilliphycus salinus ALCB114379]|uniref:hypothetical protein n=1 Tax=Capilliphycus salinus TaxID=2768948 RepID=UPI0039A59278
MAVLNIRDWHLVANTFKRQNRNGSNFFQATLTNVPFVGTLLRTTHLEKFTGLNVKASNLNFKPSAAQLEHLKNYSQTRHDREGSCPFYQLSKRSRASCGSLMDS